MKRTINQVNEDEFEFEEQTQEQTQEVNFQERKKKVAFRKKPTDDDWVLSHVKELPLAEIHKHLLSYGINLQQIKDKETCFQILEHTISRCLVELKANPNAKNVWKLLSRQNPIHFFSEVIAFPYDGSIYFLGPRFLSVHEKPAISMTVYNMKDETWTLVETKGKIPNCLKLFKKLPLNFVVEDRLIVVYSDEERKELVLGSLNLQNMIWEDLDVEEPFSLISDAPPSSSPSTFSSSSFSSSFSSFSSTFSSSTFSSSSPPLMDWIDGCIYKGELIIMGRNKNLEDAFSIYIYNLINRTWRVQEFTGVPNTECSNSSLVYQDKLISFNQDGSQIFYLDLKTFHFRKEVIANKFPNFNNKKHSHLMKFHKDKLILICSQDNFQVNYLDMVDIKWKIINVIGKRVGKVKTEATFVIFGNTLFALCGQLFNNCLLCFHLENENNISNKRSTLSEMYFNGVKDIEIITSDNQRVQAHKAVLSTKSDYFKSCLSGNFRESNQNNQIHLDFTYEAIDTIIKHMYEIEIEIDESISIELFYASDYLQYSNFQDELINFYVENLTPENALEILELCISFEFKHKKHLLKQVSSFISKNKQKVADQPTFIQFCQTFPQFFIDFFHQDNFTVPLKRVGKSEYSSTLNYDLYISVL